MDNHTIVHTSLIAEVSEEAHQGHDTAHEDVKNLLEPVVHSDNWPGMKRDVQLQPETCPTCGKFHSPSKKQRGKLNPIKSNDRGDILPIDIFAVEASKPERKSGGQRGVSGIDTF